MNRLEERLLREEVGDAKPVLCIRSATRIDAGRWWRRTPVWLCVMEDELVMLAVARRRYIDAIALEDCQATRYCHASGELVIEPGEDLMFNRFALSLTEALELMRAMGLEKRGRGTRGQRPPVGTRQDARSTEG